MERMAISIREIMNPNPVRLPANASVREAARVMRDKGIGDVLVEKNGGFCGIVTDRDIVVRALAAGRDGEAQLESICSKEITTLSPTSTDEDAVRLMREKSVRRLPVLEDGRVTGILSLGDLALEKDRHSVLGQISAAPANR
jgi:CBS domain-containing protein